LIEIEKENIVKEAVLTEKQRRKCSQLKGAKNNE